MNLNIGLENKGIHLNVELPLLLITNMYDKCIIWHVVISSSNQIPYWSDSTLFERFNPCGCFGLAHKTDEILDFEIGYYTLWFDLLSHSLYVMSCLQLFDYIEGVNVNDLIIKVDFTFENAIPISFPFQCLCNWTLP